MTVSRRSFLKSGVTVLTAAGLHLDLSAAALANSTPAGKYVSTGKKLVLIHLAGGNDGLNTIVPYASGAYYDARPTLAIDPNNVLPISAELGFHPSAIELHRLFSSNKLAVVQGVGYPNQSRSHFRSLEIFQSAKPNSIDESTWFKNLANDKNRRLSSKLIAPGSESAKIYSLESALHEVVQDLASSNPTNDIYSLTTAGFDTHANQLNTHAQLLSQLGQAVTRFQSNLNCLGAEQDVITVIFSEFGRRLAENGAAGTDHGAAAPMFIFGDAVKGGLYGEHPNLNALTDGELRHQIDFRTVYGTIAQNWLSADASVLEHKFDALGFV